MTELRIVPREDPHGRSAGANRLDVSRVLDRYDLQQAEYIPYHLALRALTSRSRNLYLRSLWPVGAILFEYPIHALNSCAGPRAVGNCSADGEASQKKGTNHSCANILSISACI
jgi:hypothetical protein